MVDACTATGLRIGFQSVALAALAVNFGYREVSVVYQQDTYGRGLLKTFLAALDGRITVVTQLPVPAHGRGQFAGGAALKASATDLIVVMASARAVLTVLHQALHHGMHDPGMLRTRIVWTTRATLLIRSS